MLKTANKNINQLLNSKIPSAKLTFLGHVLHTFEDQMRHPR